MALGSNILLRADIRPADATNFAVTWSSSNEDVLSVSPDGRVVAVGSGKAKIGVVTADGGYEAECWFSVPDESQSHPVRGVSLDKIAATLFLGEGATLQLAAQVLPTDATSQGVFWQSSDVTVATVSVTGLVTPRNEGYADITVRTEENGKTAVCKLTVLPPRVRVTGISLDKTTMDLPLYQSAKLTANFAPADATDKSVVWTSGNKSVAAVNRYGDVTALSLGATTITVTSTDGSYTASCTVTVSAGASAGDVSIDGVIDAADALLVLQYDVGLRTLSTEQKAVADINKDGLIDAADAIRILRYAAGLISEL
jgi:uncharacterized protein YjdB